MFSSFSTGSNDASGPYDSEIVHTRLRHKRQQVARACVWCRTYRIKCDASYPCRNCQSKGRRCTAEKGKGEVRTFPHAIKEIDRLKKRIKELEEKLQSLGDRGSSDEDPVERLPTTTRVVSLPTNLDPLSQHGGNKRYYNWDFTSASKSSSNSVYGPSSAFYFISQMTTYLDADLQHRATGVHSAPMRCTQQRPIEKSHKVGGDQMNLELSRSQEESILDRYWQICHPIYPVLDKSEFRAQYESLWSHSKLPREPSALVDMMLALGLQCWAATPVTIDDADVAPVDFNSGDAATQGRIWNLRGQSILAEELEDPSISTFQCHLMSIRWLTNAGFQNTAHSVIATGIRTGIILGLHLEPSGSLSPLEQDFRKRLWWTMYATDMKFAMELGRPLAVHISNVTCTLPDDHSDGFGADIDPSAAFTTQFVKLVLATRAIYITFYRKCGEVLSRAALESLYQDPTALEECATYLASKTNYLDTWVQKVPAKMRCSRNDSKEPFSTTCSKLDLQVIGGHELARQSMVLELLYHSLAMSLYRPFITFSTSDGFNGPNIRNHALSCANHAITITDLIHQLLTETTHLNGWVETFHWQWTAAISLVGYIIAYPVGPVVPMARNTLVTAVRVLEILSNQLSSAVAAGSMLRELMSKADLFISRAERPPHDDGPPTTSSLMPNSEIYAPGMISCSFDTMLHVSEGMPEQSYDAGFGAWQNALASAPGFHFTPTSFTGLEDFSADTGSMFDFLDLEAFGSL